MPPPPHPLVVLHGGPGAVHDYLLALTDLAETRAVVHYDQLDNGRSTHYPERGAEFWTVDLFVRELHNLVDALGIADRHHVLGQSWGGFLAEEYALTRPAGLHALVLADTAASSPDFVAEANRLRALLPPTLIVSRRHDEATPALQQVLHDGIAGSEWVVFEDSSQTPHVEERERYMQVVGDWLARHD